MHYAGFWKRLAALLLDGCIMLPYGAVQVWLGYRYRLFYLYAVLPNLLFMVWYHVILVARYGGTPGKLLVGLRIALVDGSRVTLRAAALRYAVQCFLGFISLWGLVLARLGMTDAQFHALGFLAQGKALARMAPRWQHPVQIMSNIWLWSELLTLLTNRRRRALHDFIGGTVVLVNRGIEVANEPVGSVDGELAAGAC